jgi:hypothetical protein
LVGVSQVKRHKSGHTTACFRKNKMCYHRRGRISQGIS